MQTQNEKMGREEIQEATENWRSEWEKKREKIDQNLKD